MHCQALEMINQKLRKKSRKSTQQNLKASWDLVELLKNRKQVRNKWVLNKITKRLTHLVAQGFLRNKACNTTECSIQSSDSSHFTAWLQFVFKKRPKSSSTGGIWRKMC